MNFFQGILLVILLMVSSIIAWKSGKKPDSRIAKSLIFFAVGLSIWSILYYSFPEITQSRMMFWLAITYLAAMITRLSLFIFSLQYSDTDNWLNKRTFSLFLIEPILTLLIFITNQKHGFFYARTTDPFFGTSIQIGPWYWITTVYNYSLLLATILIIGQTYLRPSHTNRKLTGLLFLGMVAPLVLYVATLASSAIIPGADLSPVVFLVPGIMLAIGLIRNHLLDYSIQSRDTVFELLQDGWMVLDENKNVIDLNPVAEELINKSREEIFGSFANDVLAEWPNVISQINNDTVVFDTNYSLVWKGFRHYFNLRVQPLTNNNKRLIGHVIFWRDITEQKMADDSRRQAREEMFLLLRGLASAASAASNLQSFLSEAMYQIIPVFESQSISIFLLDENQQNEESFKLSLKNQVGLPGSIAKKLSKLTVKNESVGSLFNEVLVRRQIFVSMELETDPLVPSELKDFGPGTLMVAPLRSNDQMLGIVCIVRRSEDIFTQEDRIRFNFAAEEISNFVFNDRQRQLAISLAERARLVRDLHDSVTQKLYGLLALTEAAQAGLEMGSTEMSTKVLVPIGEHARQALKEMRLFLFELSPSTLKKDGLIAALNQRLDAVEGRADMVRRIQSDENIYLTYEQQVEFFFIAQEALNNTLRHAHAKSVEINLKQTNKHIILEIEDDGLGFDTRDLKQGGIGLRSMRERSEKIGATLKMHSKPGNGTKIVLSLRKDGE
ncbi:MAG: histidine kinase N-terminal 7TM domain-containing protein [Chloroflexota bacterium]